MPKKILEQKEKMEMQKNLRMNQVMKEKMIKKKNNLERKLKRSGLRNENKKEPLNSRKRLSTLPSAT